MDAFGTLPIYPCISNEVDQALLHRLRNSKNVNDAKYPDGRNRLNVFSGNIIVTDFGDENGTLSNIKMINSRCFDAWLKTP